MLKPHFAQLIHLLTFLTLVISGCSAHHVARRNGAFPVSCRLVTGAAPADDLVRIAIDAPRGAGHSFEEMPAIQSRRSTLALMDCEGNLHPGAASSWAMQDEGKTWLFDLNQDLEKLDGNPLKAMDLSAYWQSNTSLMLQVDSIEVKSEFQVAFHLTSASLQFPAFLISPVFTLPALKEDNGRVEQLNVAGKDGRDVLEGNVHGLLTRNPDVIDYAASRPMWVRQSLPWDRSYVMVVRGVFHDGADHSPLFPGSIATGLAENVAAGDSRPFKSPAWWENLRGCGGTDVPGTLRNPASSNNSLRIRYAAGDPVARGIAERIVALASGAISTAGADSLLALLPITEGRGHRLMALEGISNTPENNADARKNTNVGENTDAQDVAYILSLPRSAFDACLEIRRLRTVLPALFDPGSGQPYTMIPLIDVRPTLIIKKGAMNVDLDGFGSLIISNPGQ